MLSGSLDFNIEKNDYLVTLSVEITKLGKKTSKTKPWFNRISEKTIKRRRVARSNWVNDTNNEPLFNRYKTRQREVSNILRCEKRKYLQNMIEKAL
ncbi:Uncharacterized protein FWK35_00020160 [Aphis craccivora]|uniref:Uncharacterized protein n=1 Tax=Aphis craccivora TaxID=307492 RepID=A0A6G0Y0B6_APHCR|nr:Uncharacterized protein FWK35_00020160 [Aphis craccivora]